MGGFILFEIFMGEAGSSCAAASNKHVQASFSTMRFIVTVGWSIYPLGYFFGYLQGAVQDDTLNLVYNLADFVNKMHSAWPSGLQPRKAPSTSQPLSSLKVSTCTAL